MKQAASTLDPICERKICRRRAKGFNPTTLLMAAEGEDGWKGEGACGGDYLVRPSDGRTGSGVTS
jgi:hypothetical protein